MPTAYPLKYLHLPPWKAIIAILRHAEDIPEDDGEFILVVADPISEATIDVTVAIDYHKGLLNLLPPSTQYSLVIERIHIGDFIGVYEAKRPAVEYAGADDLRREMSRELTSVVFDRFDMDKDEVITDIVSYELKMHPRSLRWWGSIFITFPR